MCERRGGRRDVVKELDQRATSTHHDERTELRIIAYGQDQLQSRCCLFLHQAAGELIGQTVAGDGGDDVVPRGTERDCIRKTDFDGLQLRLVGYTGNLALQHDREAYRFSCCDGLLRGGAKRRARQGYAVGGKKRRHIVQGRRFRWQIGGTLRRRRERGQSGAIIEQAAQRRQQVIGQLEIGNAEFAQDRAWALRRASRQQRGEDRLA